MPENTVRTAEMPRVRITDQELPWIYGVKPLGLLLMETGDFILLETGDKVLLSSGDTKSHVVRTAPLPSQRVSELPSLLSGANPRQRSGS